MKPLASLLILLPLCVLAYPDREGRVTAADIAVRYLRPNIDYRHNYPHERYVSAAEEHRFPGLEDLHNMHQERYLPGGRAAEYVSHQLVPSFRRELSTYRIGSGRQSVGQGILGGLSNLRNLSPWEY